jgi:transposase
LKKPKPNSKSDSDSDSSDSDSDSSDSDSDSDSDDKTSRRKQYKYKRRGRGRGRTPLRVYFRKQPKVDNTFTFQVSKTNVWIAIGVCIIISVVILLVFIGGIQKSVARTEVAHNELLQAVRELTTATATATAQSKS